MRLNLETSVEREKAVQVIDVDKEVKKYEISLLVSSIFLTSLGILRTCAEYRASTKDSRLKAIL